MQKNIRPAAVVSQFYPENKNKLQKTIDSLLSKAVFEKINGKIIGFMLPHASYKYTGEIIAKALKIIADKKIDTIIIIGDSHYEYFDGVSIWPKGEWQTPLGKVKINEELAKKILESSNRIFKRDSAHIFEHSVEVLLPFFQRALKKFEIVPLIIGSENKDWNVLKDIISKHLNSQNILIVASSDLSHYLSYKEAKKIDSQVLKQITSLSVENLENKLKDLENLKLNNAETFLCAKDAVKTLMMISQLLGGKAKLLGYANSGDAKYEDKEKTVGYASVIFTEK